MWPSNCQPVAIACSDIHLGEKTPLIRLGCNWIDIQDRFLTELRELQERITPIDYDGLIPVLIAGDLFDKSQNSVGFTNWVIERLPKDVIAIPGQHDLTYHSRGPGEFEKTSFYNLMLAKKIKCNTKPMWINGMVIDSMGWGDPIVKNNHNTTSIKVAMIHHYMWIGDESYNSFEAQRPQDNINKFKKALSTYDVAIVGDNHMGWMTRVGKCIVFNCGTFMRRKKNEIPMKPRVGIICSDGSVHIYNLDIKNDPMAGTIIDEPAVLTDYIVEKLKDDFKIEGFRDRLLQQIARVKPTVRKLLQQIVDQL